MTILYDPQGEILIKLATTTQEKAQAFQLRYAIFSKKNIFDIPELNHQEQMEFDKYDSTCEHLIALEKSTNLVVGTLRFQTAHTAISTHGFFADNEYDTTELRKFKKPTIEVGRLCISEHFKTHNIFLLFWKALSNYIHHHFTVPVHIVGLCSIPYTNHHAISKIHHLLHSRSAFNGFTMSALPEHQFMTSPAEDLSEDLGQQSLPKLLRIYLSAGAQLLGSPAQDTQGDSILAITFPLLSLFQAR